MLVMDRCCDSYEGWNWLERNGKQKGGEETRFVAALRCRLGDGPHHRWADDDPSPVATYSIAGAQLGGLCGLNDVTIQRFDVSASRTAEAALSSPLYILTHCHRARNFFPAAVLPELAAAWIIVRDQNDRALNSRATQTMEAFIDQTFPQSDSLILRIDR